MNPQILQRERFAPSRRPALAPHFAAELVRAGVLQPDQLDWARDRCRISGAPLEDVLRAHGLANDAQIAEAFAVQNGTVALVLADVKPCAATIDRLGATRCMRDGLLPIGHGGTRITVATARPDRFAHQRAEIEAVLGPVAFAIMTREDIVRGLTRVRRLHFVRAAETRSPAGMSCRTLVGQARWAVALAFLIGITTLFTSAPITMFSVAATLAILVLLANTGLLVVASLFHVRTPQPDPETAQPALMRMPKVSLLVPLLREKKIACELLKRLSRLDYPSELLDIKLVVETSDDVTRDTLGQTVLPDHVRVVTVPEGEIQTKPRAMNFALDQCDGTIIGIYDAEDAPEPDQIRLMVQQFARSRPSIACLQGRLNFYNVRKSWLSRCFAIEYATWFGMVLPALHRLGWAVPLGGTTVFFRREPLEQVGAWDAHNVTEDADLGMRLARHGFNTDLLRSTTLEEATVSPVAWIKQRSRWLKGYAITYAVHMRNPVALWRDLGGWRFLGFQVLFLGSLASTILAPVLWSFWLLAFDLPHPLRGLIPDIMGFVVMVCLFASAILGGVANALALRRQDIENLRPWIPVVHLYFPMATIAVAKSLTELLLCPFFWDKTDHGVSTPDTLSPVPAAPHRDAA